MKRAVLILGLFACHARPLPADHADPSIHDHGEASSAHARTIDPGLVTAIRAGAVRTESERARDAARHPAETLTFFGVRADSHVVELWPGTGWYTAILAPYLRDRGSLTITHFDPGLPERDGEGEARAILDRLARSHDVFDKVIRQQIATPDVVLGPDGSADIVLTFRNAHNWIANGYAPQIFMAIARVLRHGGVLGLEDHRAARELTIDEIGNTGYVSEAYIIQLVESAGLVFEARSEINANPRDTKDHPHGVWSLPPTYRGKDIDRARFTAIGESDRMTLRFRKP